MGEDWRMFVRWLKTVHAPLGHAAPLAASALFASAGLSHSMFLRVLAYALASAIALLIAVDLGRSLLERDLESANRRARLGKPLPITVFQILFTAFQAALYAFFIFIGLGPWTPFVFLVPIFGIAWLAAWRNVRLWYRQSLDYEERLQEAEEIEKRHLRQKLWTEQQTPVGPSQRV